MPYLTIRAVLFGQDLHLLPLRTLDEQQGTKTSTAVSDPSSVGTNLTYLDSPRKVNNSFICTKTKSFVTGTKLLKSNMILFYDYLSVYSWLKILLGFFLKGPLLFFSCLLLAFSPFLCSVPAADLYIFDPVYALPVRWQDGGFILEFIRSPRSSNTYHSQVSDIVSREYARVLPMRGNLFGE